MFSSISLPTDMNYSSTLLKQGRSLDWLPLSRAGYGVSILTSIHPVADIWDKIAPDENIFLRSGYLKVVEDNPPKGMGFCYLVFRKDRQAIGLAACQIQYFNVDQSLKQKENESSPCFFSTIGRYLKGLVASKVEFTTFVCGNLLLTGEHGYHFDYPALTPSQRFELVDEAMDLAKNQLNQQGAHINGFLMKDFFENTRQASFLKSNTRLNEFTIEPNMILDMAPKWTSYDEYLASMHSKYRVRAKKAAKSAKGIEKQSFDESQIDQYKEELYGLYKNVAEKSGFNLINLNINYLHALKQEFQDDFTLDAYFLDGKMVAFYTTLLNGHELEAHFLGFDHSLNRQHQIYLNILYDIVKIGIQKRVEKIVYARTALEIKSSVGARPHEMYCYMRHPNPFSNKFMAPLLDYLKPKAEERVARQPFKDRERY